jgi:hypothetical protein
VLRGDQLKEIQALREAIGTGLLMPNEGRSVLNRPRVEVAGADKLYLPSNNLTPLSSDGTQTDIREVSLAAQSFALAVKNGLLSAEEARSLLPIPGLEGPGPNPDNSEG